MFYEASLLVPLVFLIRIFLFKTSLKNSDKIFTLIFIVILLLCYTGLKIWQLRWPSTQVVLAGQTLNVLVANNNYHYQYLIRYN
jgi:hypothetical protein